MVNSQAQGVMTMNVNQYPLGNEGRKYRFAEPVITVEGLNVSYRGESVLRDASFQVRNIERHNRIEGQIVGILAPSGVGKTQMMRRVAGLTGYDSGSITYGPDHVPLKRGRVGFVLQQYPMFDHRTVLDNLVVAGMQRAKRMRSRVSGLYNPFKRASFNKRARAAVKNDALSYMDRFGIGSTTQMYPAELSGGQRQRAAILQQILAHGEDLVMVMDEPFANLDPLSRTKAVEIIREVSNLDTHNTIFVISHDVSPMLRLCDILLIMGHERDSEDGSLIPGARVVEEINLIDKGIAWVPDVHLTPEFKEMADYIEFDLFPRL